MSKSNKQDKSIHSGSHQYYKVKYKTGTLVFRCGLPGCPHFVYEPMIVNRTSLCYRCHKEFIITRKTIRSKRFHCEDCTLGRKGKIDTLDTLLDIMGLQDTQEVQEIQEVQEEIINENN